MSARCDWTVEQVKELQKRLKVWPSGVLEHETWAALTKALDIGAPSVPVKNPYSVKQNWLYKNGSLVNTMNSPNKGGIITPSLIVVHYTGDNSLQGALSWLCSPGSKVSAHLVISQTGQVWQLIPFNVKAWHAGKSEYKGRVNCNDFSIGIENVGTGNEWPDEQVRANKEIIEALKIAYGIADVVGHEDVAIPAGRKVDPGPKYPWIEILGG